MSSRALSSAMSESISAVVTVSGGVMRSANPEFGASLDFEAD